MQRLLSSPKVSGFNVVNSEKKKTSNTTTKVYIQYPADCSEMDLSHNYPPPPREMYRHRPAQQVNGHHKQTQSPNRAGPPPLLPERKPETQLSIRASRPTTTSRIATSSQGQGHGDVNSNNRQHHQHVPHHTHSVYLDNSPNLYAREINQQTARVITSPVGNQLVMTGHNDRSRNARGDNRVVDVNLNNVNYHMILQEGPVLQVRNNNDVRLRNDRSRERAGLQSQNLLSPDRGSRSSGAFHAVHRLSQPEDIYGKFLEPSIGSQNRPSSMFVPPPVVPASQAARGRAEHVQINQQSMYERNLMLQQKQQQQQFYLEQHRIQQEKQQAQQERILNNNQTRQTGIVMDNLSQDGHYHPQYNNQHRQPQHQRDKSPATSSHTQQRHPIFSSTLLTSPAFVPTNMEARLDRGNTLILPPRSPPPFSHAINRPKSSPLSTMTSEISIFAKPGSSQNATLLIRPSPVTLTTSKSVNQLSSPHKICVIDPNLHPHHYREVDFQPIDIPPNSVHQVEASYNHIPPPAPPLRSSTLPPPPRRSMLSPASPGGRSPKTAPPSGQTCPVSRDVATEMPTADALASVKLKAVNDSSQRPHVLSPVSPRDSTHETATMRLRTTPGKFSNIYVDEETTLPPPPTPDYFDELPPPPPPHELLCSDLISISLLDSAAPGKQHTGRPPLPLRTHPHIPAGDANSSTIPHKPAHHPQLLPPNARPSPKPTHQDIASKTAAAAADITSAGGAAKVAGDNTATVSERQMSGFVSSMDFEIPDDIDLSKCPGLVELNSSVPNWKRDMVEKKNQEKIEEYVKKVLKEREQEAKWKNVPEWKKKILQKKDDEDGTAASPVPVTQTQKGSEPQQVTKKPAKKPAKKPPVPPPKEAKDDYAALRPKGDMVPAAMSIDPEELAAMPPWKRELLFKRDKVPVTFSNEYNPDEDSTAGYENTSGS